MSDEPKTFNVTGPAVVKPDNRDPVTHRPRKGGKTYPGTDIREKPSLPNERKPGELTRDDVTPGTTDIDEIYNTMLRCLSREIGGLDLQSAKVGLRGLQYDALVKLSSAITAAYRARPGKPVDPTEKRTGETDEEYRQRLEALAR